MKPIQRRIGTLDVIEVPGDPNRGTILLFHGYGADADDLFPISQVYEGPTWIFPQGPLEISFGHGFTGRAWFPVDIERLSIAIQKKEFDAVIQAFPPDLNAACAAVETLIGELTTPRSHLFLGGFSQGAVLAVEIALRSPLQCGGMIIFSGTLINESQWRHLAPLHAPTPFFQSHGTHDPLLPLQKAQELADLLSSSGLKGSLHPFDGGHDIPPPTLKQFTHFLKQHI